MNYSSIIRSISTRIVASTTTAVLRSPILRTVHSRQSSVFSSASDGRLLEVVQISRTFASSADNAKDTTESSKDGNDKDAKTVPITFIEADGTEKEVQAVVGKHMLDVAHENNVELEGACGGELACSTCHLIFDKDIFDTLPEMQEEEEDMLDLAFEVTETSRLGCQIHVREDFAGIKVRIPDDGF